jgi:hypothetical protein
MVLRPGAQRLRRSGEPVAQDDTHRTALVTVRLGSRENRHFGLLFMRGGVNDSRCCFTVRDPTDTDQGRRRH